MFRPLTAAVLAASALVVPAFNANAQCIPHVSDNYAPANIQGTAYCSAMFDDGSGTGPCLFAGGWLYADGVSCAVAKLVDGQWTPLPIYGTVRALAVIDDGSGPALYAAGSVHPSVNVTKWNGSTWTALPRAGSGDVQSLAQYPAVAGGSIYASQAGQLFRFNDSAWEAVPAAIVGSISTLKVLDDGSGSKLYIGGTISSAGGQPAAGVATWDGATCQPLGAGLLNSPQHYVSAIALHDDGSGPRIHIAGKVYLSSSPTQVAALVGNTWTSRLAETNSNYQSATGLASVTDDQGPALYVATGSAKESANRVRVRRDGTWSNAGADFVGGSGTIPVIVQALDVHSTPSGNMLLALGGMTRNGSFLTASLATLKNSLWLNVQSKSRVPYYETYPFSDPASTDGALYLPTGPAMRTLDGWVPSNLPAASPPLMVGLRASIDGESCFISSTMFAPSSLYAKRASGWTTHPLPSFFRGVLASADLGAGPELYAFHNSNTDSFLSKFANGTWEQVGPALFPAASTADRLVALDLGSGPRLHVVHPTQNGSNLILQFDGAAWTTVGSIQGAIRSLTSFDVGEGPELIIAGDIPPDGATQFNGLARWNGVRLAPIGDGLGLQLGTVVTTIQTHTGPQLWAAGQGGQAYAYWNGSTWVRPYSIDITLPNRTVGVTSVTPVNNPDGSQSIFLTGTFSEFDGMPASNFAEIITCPPSCTADFNSDGDYGTDADIEAFFACLAGNCCPTCATSDFNNDGDFGTDADIESFFRVLAGGPC